jgi:HAD superfamily hydrolase (TIGR01549 family)
MNILFWIPPWGPHGDLIFFRNSLKKHLIPQANNLASSGWTIDFVLPEFLMTEQNALDKNVNLIEFNLSDQISSFSNLSDPSVKYYLNRTDGYYEKEKNHLSKILGSNYDIIILWETPVPFLEVMYPDALIVHQMPGAFSRSPYPHTVTFDPIGLYKRGSLFRYAEEIQNQKTIQTHRSITQEFIGKARDAINSLQPFQKRSLDSEGKFKKLVLLPLQVSEHYSFQADTKYINQTDFLLDVLNHVEPDVGVVVTQYVTPRVSDTVLNKEVLPVLQKRYPNLIFRDEFDRVSSVSQYLLPLVDEVITCSSSVGLQALAWPRKLTVQQDTFLRPLATPAVNTEGPDEFERSLNILSFLLNHNQPLATAVVSDREFLTELLLEMVTRKRAGMQGLDLLPSFSDIDPDYSSKLLKSFTTDRAERDLARSGERWAARQSEVGKFRRTLAAPAITAVTFDIFDTLIKRPTEVPADAYKFLERRALEVTRGIAEDFARVRVNAEVGTRESSTQGEITLSEIYASIQSYYGLSAEVTHELMQAEIEMEIRLIQPRAFGKKCWEIAISSGKPVYLISDMYLSADVIERMLLKAGYQGYKKLFLSSDYLVRKKEGGLFDISLQEINRPASEVLHIGDNEVADIEQAQARGMKTFRLLRAIDRMRGNDHYKLIYPPRSGTGERARSAIAGLTAHELFDAPAGEFEKNSHFHGNPHHMGYAGLGPLLTGFMLWLGWQAKRDGIKRLYFLSREGWILKQVYDAIHINDTGAIPSICLYASRRATRVANLRSQGDVLALSGAPFRAKVAVGELLQNRFGLTEGDVEPAAWKASGYSGWSDKLESDMPGRVKFSGLCGRIAEQILQSAASERDSYLDYLDRAGLSSESNPAIVDIGWKGNMQGSLGDLLGRPIHGYYYATLQGAEVWKEKGHKLWAYMGDLLSQDHPSVVVSHRHLAEYLTCHVERTLIRIERSGDELRPVFQSEESQSVRRHLIEEVHQGCTQFARDFVRDYGHLLGQIWIDPFLGERALASFFAKPSEVDAALLLGHYFEDALGGVSRHHIIHPNAEVAKKDSVWKEGADVVHAKATATIADSKQNPAVQPNGLRSDDRQNLFMRFEAALYIENVVVWALTSRRKYEKYKRDRRAFFEDSRNTLAKRWYRWTKRKTY